jgi:hypothetical protein
MVSFLPAPAAPSEAACAAAFVGRLSVVGLTRASAKKRDHSWQPVHRSWRQGFAEVLSQRE